MITNPYKSEKVSDLLIFIAFLWFIVFCMGMIYLFYNKQLKRFYIKLSK